MYGFGRIALNGILAGIAYLVAQEIDLKVVGNSVDDRVLLGGVAPVSLRRARVLGTALHLAVSVVASVTYVRLTRSRLRGPDWWRGVVFASIENALLYPWVLLEDFHPAIRDGRLGSYQSGTAFAQGLWRHIWFGAVLGALNRS